MVIVSRVLGKASSPSSNEAYLSPKSGVTYTSGISGIAPADLSVIASLISNNAEITNTAQTVYVDYNKAHYKVDTGNTVSITVDGTAYDFRIIGFNHDDLTSATAYGEETATGKAGITFQMVDCLSTTQQMEVSNINANGWTGCEMRSTTLRSIKSTIAAAWTNIMKYVDKKASAGKQSSTINTVSDNLFLLSEIEIFGLKSYSGAGEGNQYAYWSSHNTDSARIKNANGSATSWWERSPAVTSATQFCLVANDGNASRANASYSRGVAFGFCV